MIYEVKRLFNNLASVRSITVDNCIKKNEDLIIKYNGEIMTVSLSRLTGHIFQLNKSKFQSKVNADQSYELYDFPFVSDTAKYELNVGAFSNKEGNELKASINKKFDELFYKWVPEVGNMNHIFCLKKRGDFGKKNDRLQKLNDFNAIKKLARELEGDLNSLEGLMKK